MRSIATAAALVVALTLPARLAAHEGHAHKMIGTVTAVDASRLEMETKDGKTVSVVLTVETQYRRGKTAIKAGDVKAGDRAVVTMTTKEGKMIASEVLVGTAEDKPHA